MTHLRLTTRPARPEELTRLAELLGELFTLESHLRPDPQRQRRGLERLMERDDARVLVLDHGGHAGGMATIQTLISTAEGGAVGWIEDVIVAHRLRGIGGGRLLLEGIGAWARERGLTRLQLAADRDNGPALGFYQRTGWTKTGMKILQRSL